MPRFIVVLRAIIRPVFTILVGFLDFLFFTGSGFTADQAALLKAVNMIVLVFWFGERAVNNSGIVGLLLGRKGDGVPETARARAGGPETR